MVCLLQSPSEADFSFLLLVFSIKFQKISIEIQYDIFVVDVKLNCSFCSCCWNTCKLIFKSTFRLVDLDININSSSNHCIWCFYFLDHWDYPCVFLSSFNQCWYDSVPVPFHNHAKKVILHKLCGICVFTRSLCCSLQNEYRTSTERVRPNQSWYAKHAGNLQLCHDKCLDCKNAILLVENRQMIFIAHVWNIILFETTTLCFCI